MAYWPDSPRETARWIAALTSPFTPGVGGGVAAGTPAVGGPLGLAKSDGAPSRAAADAPPRLTATVDLECPYLRDLVLAAFASRPAWTVVRADPGPGARPTHHGGKGAGTNSGSDDEEGEDDAAASTPHPATATSIFHWGEYERIDWPRVHAGECAASSYCVRKGLTRKAHLAFNLKKWVAKKGGGGGGGGGGGAAAPLPSTPGARLLAAALPETHVLQVDDPEYVDEALADLPEVRDAAPGRAGLWIAKPSVCNRAAGVAVVDSAAGLRAALARAPGASEWVVQRYVHPPHLLGGRKWHLRVYALAVGALEVWVFGGALVLRARAPYYRRTAGGPATAPLDDLDAHLTNTCRNAVAGGGGGGKKPASWAAAAAAWVGRRLGFGAAAAAAAPRPPPPADPVDAGLALSLADLPAALVAENGEDPRAARDRAAALAGAAAALVGEAFAAVSAELSFFPLPSAWELFGFDFMVDASWRPFLLEANADPDVGASGERLRPVVAALVEGTLARTADRVAAAAAAGAALPAVLAPGGFSAGGEEDAAGGAGDPFSRWTRVFVRDAGRAGPSGMKVE